MDPQELFFMYTENNFVHRYVAGIVACIISSADEGPADSPPPLFVNLFKGKMAGLPSFALLFAAGQTARCDRSTPRVVTAAAVV